MALPIHHLDLSRQEPHQTLSSHNLFRPQPIQNAKLTSSAPSSTSLRRSSSTVLCNEIAGIESKMLFHHQRNPFRFFFPSLRVSDCSPSSLCQILRSILSLFDDVEREEGKGDAGVHVEKKKRMGRRVGSDWEPAAVFIEPQSSRYFLQHANLICFARDVSEKELYFHIRKCVFCGTAAMADLREREKKKLSQDRKTGDEREDWIVRLGTRRF